MASDSFKKGLTMMVLNKSSLMMVLKVWKGSLMMILRKFLSDSIETV